MQIDTQARAHVVTFEHVTGDGGRPLRVPIPIPRGRTGKLYASVAHVTNRARELDEAMALAKKMHWLSDSGRRERVAEPYANTRRAADTVVTDATHALGLIADRRAALYEPPMPSDATQDTSIQTRYAAMPKGDRDKLHAQMAAGRADAALFALLRDPLAMGSDAEIIRRTIWQPRVERERAAEIAALDDQEEEAVASRAAAAGLLQVLEQFAAAAPREPRATEDSTYLDAMGQ